MPRKDDQLPSHPNRPFAYKSERLGEAEVKESLGQKQVDGANLNDGAVDMVAFATGLRPIQIVAGLPVLPDATNYPQGAVVFLTTDNKLYRSTGPVWTPAVPTVDLTGQITSAQITDLAVTTAKLNDLAVSTAKIADLAISTGKLAALAVDSTKLADLAVVTAKLDVLAVTNAKIANATITGGKLVADTITANEIAASAITSNELAANAVIAGKIAALTIVAGDIAASTITGAKIAANTITAGNIAALTITAAEIAAGTITGAKIAALTITASNIAALTITAAEIAASTITGAKIAALTITAANIAAGTITATELATDSVTANKILAGAVTAAKIAVTTLDAISANLGVITAGQMTFNLASSYLRFKNPAVAHGMTSILATDTYGDVTDLTSTVGGLVIRGLSAAAGYTGLFLIGYGQATPTAPPVLISAQAKSGTGAGVVPDNSPLLWLCNGDISTPWWGIVGDGGMQLRSVSTTLNASPNEGQVQYLGPSAGQYPSELFVKGSDEFRPLLKKTFVRVYRSAAWTPVVGTAIPWDGEDAGDDDGSPGLTSGMHIASSTQLQGLRKGVWLLFASVNINVAPGGGLAFRIRMRQNATNISWGKRLSVNGELFTMQCMALVVNPAITDTFDVIYDAGTVAANTVGAGKDNTFFCAVRL